MKSDIRWVQRFQNYENALAELEEAVYLSHTRNLTKLEKQGVIQGFEYTHELAWNTLKDYLTWMGIPDLIGSRDSIRQAFQIGLIEDGETWMEMIQSRNLTSHTYEESIAEEIYEKIVLKYYPCFVLLKDKLSSLKGRN